jgi:hypothetical protein
MSFVTQPIIQGLPAEFFIAFVTIAIGVFFENGRKDRAFLFSYVIGFVVMVVTTQFDALVLIALVPYSLIGILFALVNFKKSFGLFGSKVYGSLLFTMACLHTQPCQEQFNVLINAVTTREEAYFFLGFYYTILLIGWGIVAIVVWYLNRRIVKSLKKLR